MTGRPRTPTTGRPRAADPDAVDLGQRSGLANSGLTNVDAARVMAATGFPAAAEQAAQLRAIADALDAAGDQRLCVSVRIAGNAYGTAETARIHAVDTVAAALDLTAHTQRGTTGQWVHEVDTWRGGVRLHVGTHRTPPHHWGCPACEPGQQVDHRPTEPTRQPAAPATAVASAPVPGMAARTALEAADSQGGGSRRGRWPTWRWPAAHRR